MRASEPVSCWPHKPREWRSTRQPATKFRSVTGESFNGRTAGLQPADGGSIPSSSTIFVRVANAEREPLTTSVAVAEWIGGGLWNRPRGFNFLRPPQCLYGPSSNGTGPSPPKAEIPVRIRMGRPSIIVANFRERGRRPIRCAWDAEITGFDSQVPDQSFSGIAKLGRRRTVNAVTRRFESCSRSQAGLAQTGRVPLLQSGCPWFDSRTPHQVLQLP